MSFEETIVYTVKQALAEDLGSGDLTASLIPVDSLSHARVICRERAVICGRPWFDQVFLQLDPAIDIAWDITEGEQVHPDQTLCQLKGLTRAILSGERTALNYLQTLSGTASKAHQYAQTLTGTKTTLLDTRKTLPGLRQAQKYAVRCGGGTNHRMGLYDGILLKENHIMAAGSISNAVTQAKQQHRNIDVEVEVENLTELREALNADADVIMLDNFDLDTMQQAVTLTHSLAQGKEKGKGERNTKLEASGGVDLNTLKQIANTGVDYVSVGSLTKSVAAVDLSMRFVVS